MSRKRRIWPGVSSSTQIWRRSMLRHEGDSQARHPEHEVRPRAHPSRAQSPYSPHPSIHRQVALLFSNPIQTLLHHRIPPGRGAVHLARAHEAFWSGQLKKIKLFKKANPDCSSMSIILGNGPVLLGGSILGSWVFARQPSRISRHQAGEHHARRVRTRETHRLWPLQVRHWWRRQQNKDSVRDQYLHGTRGHPGIELRSNCGLVVVWNPCVRHAFRRSAFSCKNAIEVRLLWQIC